ncbi:hypothetical protein CPB86DRAFT_821921 [Serendipita vermifera]|nr:hypothetical protein CPB86DRAFT_821921 [Serendipita vermifera]
MSASFALLPTEILLTVLEILAQQWTGPVVGYDAAWINPLGVQWSNDPFEKAVNEQVSRHTDILNLQKVNRRLHELCTPFVYQELSLMGEDLSHEKLIAERIPKYAQYIRTIRFYLYHGLPSEELEDYHQLHEKYILEILSMCAQATSIGIYFHHAGSVILPENMTSRFCGKIFDIITQEDRAPLKSFGLYSMRLIASGAYDSSDDHIQPLLEQLNSSSYLQQHLKNLDLVIQHLPRYQKTAFPLLASLSFRHSWHSIPTLNWSMHQISEWVGQTKLIRLQLINCTNTYARDIQECVRACPSLQYLMVSACGAYNDVAPPPRTPGWTKEHDALNKHRAPLLSLHIEHTNDWEIIALGVIPTLHLNVGSVYGVDLATSVETDPEIFPGLKRLSLPNTNDQFLEYDEHKREEQIDLVEKFCEKRGVTLDYQAEWFANDASG